MANSTEWRAYCTDCEVITVMAHTGNRTEGLCQECGNVQKLIENPKILKQMRDINTEISGHFGDIMMLQEKLKSLGRMLSPFEVKKAPEWERLTVSMACHKCGRSTNRAFNALPHCYPNCKPRPGKISAEEVPEVLDMLREYVSGGENDDTDYEVMKFKTPEDK